MARGSPAGKEHEVANHLSGVECCFDDLIEVSLDGVEAGSFEGELGKAQDIGQGFIELVGNTGGQLSDGGETVGVANLVFEIAALEVGLFAFKNECDFAGDAEDEVALFFEEGLIIEVSPAIIGVVDFDFAAGVHLNKQWGLGGYGPPLESPGRYSSHRRG